MGSPTLFYTSNGMLVRQISRLPFGHVVQDTGPHLGVPIGFCGAIYDEETQLYHFQGPFGSRAYDGLAGAYLTMGWRRLLKTKSFHQPKSLQLYRFKDNDPINRGETASHFKGPTQLLDMIASSLRLSFPAFEKSGLDDVFGFPFVKSQRVLMSAAKVGLSNALKASRRITAIQPSALEVEGQPDPRSPVPLANLDSPIGKFVAFTALQGQGQIKVSSLDAGTINEVPRGIFHSVLSGARLIDFHAVSWKSAAGNQAIGRHQSASDDGGGDPTFGQTPRGSDTFFLAKPHVWQKGEDVKALHRLGPRINLTSHETQTEDGGGLASSEVKIHLDDTVLVIKYGTDPPQEKGRLLRHAVKVMTRKMWMREKEVLMLNRKNRGVIEPLALDWSKQHKDQLSTKGYVEGYLVKAKVDLQKFPQLAYDLNSYKFAKKSVEP